MPTILLVLPSQPRIFRPSYGPDFVDLRVCDGVSDVNMIFLNPYFNIFFEFDLLLEPLN